MLMGGQRVRRSGSQAPALPVPQHAAVLVVMVSAGQIQHMPKAPRSRCVPAPLHDEAECVM